MSDVHWWKSLKILAEMGWSATLSETGCQISMSLRRVTWNSVGDSNEKGQKLVKDLRVKEWYSDRSSREPEDGWPAYLTTWFVRYVRVINFPEDGLFSVLEEVLVFMWQKEEGKRHILRKAKDVGEFIHSQITGPL